MQGEVSLSSEILDFAAVHVTDHVTRSLRNKETSCWVVLHLIWKLPRAVAILEPFTYFLLHICLHVGDGSEVVLSDPSTVWRTSLPCLLFTSVY